jgi:hypothetical protein
LPDEKDPVASRGNEKIDFKKPDEHAEHDRTIKDRRKRSMLMLVILMAFRRKRHEGWVSGKS